MNQVPTHRQTVHGLIEAQAERTPDAIALHAGEVRLTYRELNERANQVAHALRTLGIGPDHLVSICLERSVELIMALLGVLKAGGAYVPLDPAYPQDRLAYMMADSRVKVLLTAEALRSTVPAGDAAVICLDTDRGALAAQPVTNPDGGAGPESLIYVMYTSGSTGKPKGVMLTHGNVVNHNLAMAGEFGLQPSDRVLQSASISFDISVEEIFPTLMTGATLVLLPHPKLPTIAEFQRAVAEGEVTVVDLPTAYWHEWAAELSRTGAAVPASVRLVAVGGEKASAERLAMWQQVTGGRLTWINTYGPTETAVVATVCTVRPGTAEVPADIPIGRPIAGTEVHLLDGHLQPVSDGVPGELYIGGAQVARGYLNRPDLTAERFLDLPPGRLYRTGDLARRRPDGQLEFIGRVDNQVKIRGFRIELGEIEAVLQQHAAVRDAVVLAQETEAGHKRLVAYIVPADGGAMERSALRAFLRQELPEYMIPAAFVRLEALPLSPNGKVDRKALPAPAAADFAADAEYTAPRTPDEERLAAIWAPLLGVDRVSVTAGFFDLGGHSLLATQMLSRIREAFGVELPMRAVFEAPTVAELARTISGAANAAPAVHLVPVAREGRELPLSFAQQRLWFLDQLEGGTGSAYHIAEAVTLTGALRLDALMQGLNQIVRRHEALRTTFRAVDGRPVQVIAPSLMLDLPVVEVTPAQVQAYVSAEARRPFRLAEGPLVRALLLRLGETEHVLLVTMHHIVSDGWSSGVLLTELAALYAGEELAPLPVQYADYAAWQRQWLQGEVLKKQLGYWQQQLAGAPPVLELPTDRPRPAVASSNGATQRAVLPKALADALGALGRREGATLFMTLLAAFNALLHRYSGQDDIAMGTPVAGRTRAELEPMIGFFVNTLVMRTDLSGSPSFQELLRRVRETALSAYAHQDAPFDQVVEALRPERSLSYHPLFQVMFVLQNAPAPRSTTGLAVNRLPVDTGAAAFDLTLTMEETEAGLLADLEYNTDLFDAATIARMLGHFETLLAAIAADPAQPVGRLALITPAEREQVLARWSRTAVPQQENRCIHDLFEAQATRQPAAVALQFGSEQMTYACLNEQANRLARHLRGLGVGPDVTVGLFAERSLEMVVGLLAVLKAGGAYVPLDPTYPAERLAYMLRDSGAPVVLTQERLLMQLGSLGFEGAAFCLDADFEAVAGNDPANLGPIAGPEHLAYTMYTSGSTGQPKGVEVEHRNLVAFARAGGVEHAIVPGDRVLQFSTISFDTAVEEIFLSLTHGATLVLRTEAQLTAVDQFLAQVEGWGITVLDLPTAYWHELTLQMAEQGCRLPASVRRVIIGGEAVLPERAALWLKHAGAGVELANTYGPTEATVIATSCLVVPGPDGLWVPSIGRPLPGYEIYVLDGHLQPVPAGVPGELYIGGPAVARGYRNRPEQTAERFLATPLGRLYRTGDLARWLPDGQIQFVGRTDDQVKIRGFRVELAEVESRLGQHESVRDAVVVARQDRPGAARRLVAYVVPAGVAVPTATDLRTYLKERLPEYMVPSAFVTLEALPLLPNGKVNRRALPAPDPARTDEARGYVAPRTPAEATLAQIWAQVLGLERVSVEENFFELGGDSILSLQVVARAAQAGLQLTPKQLFQYQTVAGQATVAVAGTARAVEAEQGAVTGPLPLTPIQQWFFGQGFPEQHHWNQDILLEVRSDVAPDLLEQAVQALVAHHDMLRARYRRNAAGEWMQAIAAPGTLVPLERFAVGADIEATCTKLQASLDLTDGPLVRAAWFDGGAGQPGRLYLVVHHLVVDGVSWRILLEDLQTAVEQLRRGEPVVLPRKSTAFKQWAEQLAAYVPASVDLQKEAAYWLAEERQQAPVLPVDFPGGEPTLATSHQVVVTLGAGETRTLLQEVGAAYRTQINDVLLTALAQVAAAWTGDRRLLVSLEGHGREEILEGVDLSRTVGWFTTVFPVLLDLGAATGGPGEALKRIKEQLRAVPHRGIGYGLLRYLSGDASLAQQLDALPQPSLSFNYLGQFDQSLRADDLFRPATEATGPNQSLLGSQDALLEVEARVLGGALTLEFHYSEQVHRRSTVEALAAGFVQALRGLIAHCTAPEAGGFTPSDFPNARLTQTQLDALVARVGRREVEDVYALSPMQQGMLFETLMAPHSGVYFVQTEYAFTGGLDEAAFAAAWQQVVERHPILRTGFVWEGVAEPVQVVYRHARVPLTRLDWRGLPDAGPGERTAFEAGLADRLAQFLADDLAAGFDLRQPAMRLTLIRTGADTYRLIWSIHHALIDGWSSPLILQEVFSLYAALRRGETLALPPVRPYGEYIAWLHQRDRAEAEAFWRQALASFGAPTPLVVDEPQPGLSGYAELSAALPADVFAALQGLAQQQQVTLNTVMQGAWALLLHRYSREEDVLFGATVAGRGATLPGIESMVGPFLNTLPVRVQVTPAEPVAAWLRKLQLQQVEARQFEHAALVDVQGWSEVPRGTRLFESLLVFENYPGSDEEALAQTGLQAELASAAEQTNYPLTVVAEPGDDALTLSLIYDRSRFAPETAARMLGHLQTLLTAIAARPEQPVAEVAMLTEAERQQVLIDFNQTDAAYPQERLVHQLVEEQAARAPGAPAVVQDGVALTYGELNRRANQLARYLRRCGVGREGLVAVLAERSPAMLTALLAVLKAGAAYVPIDPAYPAERVVHMLADTGAPVLLTVDALTASLPPHGAQVFRLDADWESVAAESGENLESGADGHSLAYVIYTSGSTGTPKGVAVEHGSLLNLLFWHRTAYGVTAASRATQLAGVAFDASVWEIWPYLTAGASLHLPDADTRLSPAKLAQWLVAERIDIAFLPTPLAEELLRCEWPGTAALRFMLTGGDQLRTRPTAAHPFALVNHYGPTESTVVATAGEVAREGTGLPAIGRPIANTRIYLLDANLQPRGGASSSGAENRNVLGTCSLVPVGVYGELCIGGGGLARGYLNRPDLTAEKFVDSPMGRIYKTGDLARWLPDGQIEFLGRVDNQVKIRGFRIELGEIESVLTQHPAVRDAVVIAWEEQPGVKRLVAYVVPSAAPADVADLRAHLKARLPEYMVPAAFVRLAALPLTPNGKVDRKALPAPAPEDQVSMAYVAPRTPTEEQVAAIWAEVLGLSQVSAEANFFALGGHSLLATQVISRVQERLRVALPLRALFDAPTVAGLAARVDAVREANAAAVEVAAALQEAPAIRPADRTRPLPLSPAQRRLWFIDQMEPGSATYNMSLALRLTGALDPGALEQAFTALVARHESLRTTFATVENAPVQVIAAPQPFRLAVAELADETEALEAAAAEAKRPFDLANGPLFRGTLLKLADTEHILLLTLHHIITDGWSMGLLLNELAALYRGESLPGLPLQYADFAVWQREWLQAGALEEQLAFWKQQLTGSPALLELPTDRPRPPVQSFRGAAVTRSLRPDLLQALGELSRREGVTLFMTLLAAYQTLLARYSGQEDIPVGSPIAGRNRAETEGLVGFFVNTLVLRTDLSGAPSFADLLGRVREVTLGAYAHQELPFDQVVEALQPERNLSHTPLFQTFFVLQNTPPLRLNLPGLTVAQAEVEDGIAPFDLVLTAEEAEGALACELRYATDLFDRTTAERMLAHFEALLAAAVANPALPITELNLLTAAERAQLLPGRAAADGLQRCIHEVFEEQARLTPDAPALAFGDTRLTYAELNRRANQLAHHLCRLGVGPEVMVGLCAERSVELAVGLLATLKAGGAYVPMDPTYPADRLAYMLADSGVKVLLTLPHLAAQLPPHAASMVDLAADYKAERTENPVSGATPDSLAYVIYTSGSTGRPKGVLVQHSGLYNLAAAQIDAFRVTPASRVLQFASVSFDASVSECSMAWVAGATLVMAAKEDLLPGPGFLQLLREKRISVVTLPPSVLAVLPPDNLPDLATVVTAGEACSAEVVARWAPGRHFVNAYGPTEATVCATLGACTDTGRPPTIGRPLANVPVLLLDRNLQPVPVGVPGEIHIGGIGLARGYHNRPELTAEKFIQSSIGRLYKTGDLARWRENGEIEYLGRLDHQVKIRGFRIEIGEVEAVLAQHPQVIDTVVLAREDQPGVKRLVAYVVSTSALEVGSLREFLKARLPEFMVPAAFVVLDAFPLTPNGKVDRKALPAPDQGRPEQSSGRGHVAPRTPQEESLARIWAQVLGREQVSVHDNFFELGGDSILSLQIIFKAGEAGLKLTPKQLFQHQTVAAQAAVAETVATDVAEQGPVTGPVPLTPIQTWFFEQNYPAPHHWNQDDMQVLPEPLDPAIIQNAVQALIEHHDMLRARYRLTEAGWSQEIAADHPEVPFTQVDLSALPPAAQPAALTAAAGELQASLNLADGPILRVAQFLLGPGKGARLLMIIHHLAVDGVSWRILQEDFQAVVRQLQSGQPVQLPRKTTSFQHWACKLQEYAQSEAAAAELPYWLSERRAAAVPLPVDFPGGVHANTSSQTVPLVLSADETRAILQEVTAAYHAQVNDVLLTALALALQKWTGRSSFLVDLEGHGREEIIPGVDLTRTVGWFTSVYPVLLEPGTPATKPGDALKAVKEQLRAVPNKGIGHGLLKYLSGNEEAEAKLRSLPQASIAFNYLGQFEQAGAEESTGHAQSPLASQDHPLLLTGYVTGGQLRLTWLYSANIHRRTTVETLSGRYLEALRALIAQSRQGAGGYTPSDFGKAKGLDQAKLDKLMSKIGSKGLKKE